MAKKTRIVKVTSVFFILIITSLVTLILSQSMAGIAQDAAPKKILESQQLQADNQNLQSQKLIREIEKLQQETIKLKKETENIEKDFWEKNTPLVTTIASLANTITALVAIVGAYFTIYKQVAETRIEKTKHIDERFASIIQDLGSEKLEIKASATVSILTFLEEGYEKYYEQVYMIVLTHLKLDSKDTTINKLLVKTFEQVIDKYLKKDLPTITQEERKFKLDLSGCRINGIRLSNLPIKQADLSYAKLNNAILDKTTLIEANLQNTDLTYASLNGTNLNQANLKEAVFNNYQNTSQSNQKIEIINSTFEGAILISAKMSKVKIIQTNFSSAQMQEVNLNGAELENVGFKHANLNTAFFKGTSFINVDFAQADLQKANFQSAKLDDITLNSIIKAKDWTHAEFDNDIKQKLKDKMLAITP